MPTAGHYRIGQASCGESSEDRIVVLEAKHSCLILIADGVGGLSYGGEAAELVGEVCTAAWRESRLDSPEAIVEVLQVADRRVQAEACCGETTAVVLVIRGEFLLGASVGNSEAWMITDHGYSSLTRLQPSRPLIGSGIANPAGFQKPLAPASVLLVGSDGLFARVPAWMAAEVCRTSNPTDASDQLLDRVRLPSGIFADDVSIVVYRPATARTSLRSDP